MGWGFWTHFLFFLVVGTVAAARPTEPSRYDLSGLALISGGEITLVGGERVRLPASWSHRRVVFEDLLPGANWRHPGAVRLEFLDGRVEVTLPVTMPPRDLWSCEWLSGPDTRAKAPLDFKIADLSGVHKITQPDRFWAFLLNGHAEQRHWNDFSFLYRVLVQVYGYRPDHIVVADQVFQNRMPDLDGNGTSDITYGSTQAEVKKAFDYLKQTLTKNDRLFFVVNDHGGRLDGESTITLYDVELKVSQFMPYLAALPAGEVISVHGQCNAGGFVRPSVGAGRVAVAAATDLEVSWATVDFRFDEFFYHFISALGWQNHEGKALSADGDGDGKISLKEAYVYAAGADKAPESPFYESQTNTGKAAEMGVGF